MRALFLFLFSCLSLLNAYETDFDYVVVGTSPISMLEAVYKTFLGNRVLVVEQAGECGGAWKSIDICGIAHVDMGCHEFGNDSRVKSFLEEYAGCEITSNTPSSQGAQGHWGLYPLHGCYELTHNLELLMQALGTVLLLNSKVESVVIDKDRAIAEVSVNGKRFTTSKVIVTRGSDISFTNMHRSKYPHIYMLIADQTPSRFTYIHPSIEGVSRAMNVTRFAGLEGSGMQLIAVQVYAETHLNNAEKCLEGFKRQGLVDSDAQIIRVESYIYEQGSFNQSLMSQVGGQMIFEMLDTTHIANIGRYADKWKQGMRPWKEVMAEEISAE